MLLAGTMSKIKATVPAAKASHAPQSPSQQDGKEH
jgi:hypothetical protein